MHSDVDPKTLSYEAEVAPRWAEPFARLLLSVAPIDPGAMVLDVLCGTGSLCLPLLDRLEPRGRVVALDPSSGRLAIARRKAGSVVGKRLFFRHERLERLSFADDVFDVVLSNAGVLTADDPNVLAECVRVAKPGGLVAMTLPLRGTLVEGYDLLREVIERKEDDAALRRLDEHLARYPTDDDAIHRLERVGLRDVSLSRSAFGVEFPSGRAFVHSELVAQLFAESWSAVVGAEAHNIFAELAGAIDTYFGTDPFEVTIQAACLIGRKEEYQVLDELEAVSESASSPVSDAHADAPEPDEVTPVRAFAIPVEAVVVAATAGESAASPVTPATDEASNEADAKATASAPPSDTSAQDAPNGAAAAHAPADDPVATLDEQEGGEAEAPGTASSSDGSAPGGNTAGSGGGKRRRRR